MTRPNRQTLTACLVVLGACLGICLVACVAPAHADPAPRVSTRATLFVGFPSGENASEGVLVVPGTVIPNVGLGASYHPTVTTEEQRSQVLAKLTRELTQTFRLEHVEASFSESHALAIDEPVELSPPAADLPLRITVELLGFDPKSATYRVRFVDRNVVLADSRVAALRGRQAVIGGLNGEEAPYLFLVLEPALAPGAGTAGETLRRVGEGITAPRRIESPPPSYTLEARKERIQGLVIVQAVIDETGIVQDVSVLKGLPKGLTEAVVDAIRQWKFEPARDEDGNPVAVYYNLTINFTLAEDKDNGTSGEKASPANKVLEKPPV